MTSGPLQLVQREADQDFPSLEGYDAKSALVIDQAVLKDEGRLTIRLDSQSFLIRPQSAVVLELRAHSDPQSRLCMPIEGRSHHSLFVAAQLTGTVVPRVTLTAISKLTLSPQDEVALENQALAASSSATSQISQSVGDWSAHFTTGAFSSPCNLFNSLGLHLADIWP